jgi:hypothetical protein
MRVEEQGDCAAGKRHSPLRNKLTPCPNFSFINPATASYSLQQALLRFACGMITCPHPFIGDGPCDEGEHRA